MRSRIYTSYLCCVGDDNTVAAEEDEDDASLVDAKIRGCSSWQVS